MDINKLVEANFQEAVVLRRYFHTHPEMSGKELKTVAYIDAYLQKLGIKSIVVENGGVLGVLDSGKKGKTLLIRSDIDALPIEENPNNLKQKKICCSPIKGLSHGCGHDCHMAMSLTAAKILAANKDAWQGSVVFCFERGEETGGNIRYLLPYLVNKSHLHIDGCYSTHVRWDIPAGKVMVMPGATMAGGFGFTIKLLGKFGHGARPDLAINPIDCFVAIYEDLKAFRLQVDPREWLTYSIGQLEGGHTYNIIEGNLTFGGSCRFFNMEKAGSLFQNFLLKSLEKNGALYNCQYEIPYMPDPLYPTTCDPVCESLCEKAVTKYLGPDANYKVDPWMASETFSCYMQLFPGVHTFTGIANEATGCGAPHHTPEFDVDESGLKAGITMALGYALEFLNTDFKTNFRPTTEPVEKLAARNV